MSFGKKTIRDINLAGKKVLLRTDYNVSVKNGQVQEVYRILRSIPTIEYLIKKGCKVVIISHLGRPNGHAEKQFSLAPIAVRLQKELGRKVGFVSDCLGEKAKSAKKALKSGEIILLENLRFYPEEEQNDLEFAKELADGMDVFVQDGFGVVHRSHASTDVITKLLPSVSGLLLEKEVLSIQQFADNPEKPLMAIVGGMKISDKIQILKKFIKSADYLVVGGAMANNFLLARGIEVGQSVVSKEDVENAKDIMRLATSEAKKRRFVFYVPQDGVVADEIKINQPTRVVDWDTHMVAEVESYPKQPDRFSAVVKKSEKILDIGPFSAAFISGLMQNASTVIWNGTMGVAELSTSSDPVGPFAHGTEVIIESLMGEFGYKPKVFIGGGDTAGYVEQRGLVDCFDFVSTGGGASLDLLSGKKLPGVEALNDK